MYSLELQSLKNLGIPQNVESIENIMAEIVECNAEIEAMIGNLNEKK